MSLVEAGTTAAGTLSGLEDRYERRPDSLRGGDKGWGERIEAMLWEKSMS